MESHNEEPKLMKTSLDVDSNLLQNIPVVIENEEDSQAHPAPVNNNSNKDTQNTNVLREQLTNISSVHQVLQEQKPTTANHIAKKDGIQSVKPKQLFALRGSPSQDTFKCPKIIQIPPKLRRPKTSTPTPVTNKMPILNAKGQIMPSEMGPHLPWERSQPQKLITTTAVLKHTPTKLSLSKVVEVSNRGNKTYSNMTCNKKSDSEIPHVTRQRPRSIQAIPLRNSPIINSNNITQYNNNLAKSFPTRKPQNLQNPMIVVADSKQRQSSTIPKSNITKNMNKDSAPKSRLLDEIKRNLKISPYNHSTLHNMSQGVTNSRPRSRQQKEKGDNKSTPSYAENSNLKCNNSNKNRMDIKDEFTMKTNRFQSDQLLTKKMIQPTETKSRNISNNNNSKAESKSHNSKNIRDKLIEKLMSSTNVVVEKPIISLPRIVSIPILSNHNNNNISKNVNILKSTNDSKKQPEKRAQVDKPVDLNNRTQVRQKESNGLKAIESISNNMNKVNKISIPEELSSIEKNKELQEMEQHPPNIISIPDSANTSILTENVRQDKGHEIEMDNKVKLSETFNHVNNNEEINIVANNTSNKTCSKDSDSKETLKPLVHNKDDLPFPIPKELMKDQEFENEYEQDSSPMNPRLNSPVSPATSRQSIKDPREKLLMSRLASQVDFLNINDDITSDDDDDDNNNDEEDEEVDVEENESCHSSSFSSHFDSENKNANDDDGNGNCSTTHSKEIPNTAHDFVSDYLQLESLREVNHVSQVICRTKICDAVKGADPNLTLEQLVLAKSRFLQLPCFSDAKFFPKIKVPPQLLRGKQRDKDDKDLVTIQYLQTKMDDLYQKKLKNLEQKRNHQQNSSSSSSSSETATEHQNTSDAGSHTKFGGVHQRNNKKGISFSSPESYVKSLERVLYSLQHPKWAKNCFAAHSNEDSLLNEEDEEDEDSQDQDSNSNTSDDEKILLEQVKSSSSVPVDQGESSEERAAIAKRILSMYTKGQKKIKLNSGGGDASNLSIDIAESDQDEDNDKHEDDESESELQLP